MSLHSSVSWDLGSCGKQLPAVVNNTLLSEPDGSVQGSASQKGIALSSVPALSGGEGVKAAVEELFDPEESELIHRKGAGGRVQRPKYPQHDVSASLCSPPSLN